LWADTPAGIPRGEKALAKFRAGEEIRDEEIELRHKDGSAVWVRLSMRPIRDATGRVDATRSTLTDVTALKRAEDVLRASEERLARVLASAMDAIVTIEASRRIEIFNEAEETIFHCPSSDVIGQPLDRFLTGSTALPGTAAGVAARRFSAVADSSHTPLLRGGWDNDLDEAGVHVIDQA